MKEIATPITSEKEIESICRIASNDNRIVTEIVSKTLGNVGLDGVINMTESPTGFSRFALVNGLVLERGLVSELFAEFEPTEGREMLAGNCVELEHPLVLVVADKITQVSEVVPVLELCKRANRPLFLICEDLQPEPLSTMVYNNEKGIV